MKLPLLTFSGLLLISACSYLPGPTQEKVFSTLIPTTAALQDTIPCAPENWNTVITAIEQTDLGDGTELVTAKIGIENNDSLWGKVRGPYVSNDTVTKESIFLTTEDGSLYQFVDSPLFETPGQIETMLLPPEFVTLGKIIDGNPYHFNFSFLLPNSKTPDTITIGNMIVECIQPHVVGENGQIIYREKQIQLPAKTYNLGTDVVNIREAPSSQRYPNLVGAELVTPDWKETIFITDFTRTEDTISIIFDFTNFSSHAKSPSFEGYIMGDDQFFICQNDCEHKQAHRPIEPGQTAQDLTWRFTVPENETNLVFVYVYGGTVDLNQVYRVNLE
jgi:hypothetical protein